MIKRIIRIYPVYFIVLLATILLYLWTNPDEISWLLNGFNSLFPDLDLSRISLIQNFVLIYDVVPHHIVSQSWTLTYELIISMFFMPILWKLRKYGVLLYLLIISTYLYFDLNSIDSLRTLSISLYYLSFFIAGYLVYNFQDYLKILAKIWLLPVYIILFSFSFWSYGLTFYNEHLKDFLAVIGSLGFIILSIHNAKFDKVLSNKYLLKFGELSFSFYLIHILVIYFYLWGLHLNYYLAIMLGFISTTILSYFSYQYIEVKLVKFIGKYI